MVQTNVHLPVQQRYLRNAEILIYKKFTQQLDFFLGEPPARAYPLQLGPRPRPSSPFQHHRSSPLEYKVESINGQEFPIEI